MLRIEREIRYEAERDRSFADEIKKMPGCELMDRCIQCGTCSGACPVSIFMDYTPRKVIELTRSGFKQDVLKSTTIWLCASCYACTVECPKQIGITDVMYALKQKAIEEKVYPPRFPIPVLAREFFKMVRAKGRIAETKLAILLFLKTQFLKIFGMQRLGIDLLRTGRFSPFSLIFPESMKDPAKLTRLIDRLDAKLNSRELEARLESGNPSRPCCPGGAK